MAIRAPTRAAGANHQVGTVGIAYLDFPSKSSTSLPCGGVSDVGVGKWALGAGSNLGALASSSVPWAAPCVTVKALEVEASAASMGAICALNALKKSSAIFLATLSIKREPTWANLPPIWRQLSFFLKMPLKFEIQHYNKIENSML
jgi:hypothetical protein